MVWSPFFLKPINSGFQRHTRHLQSLNFSATLALQMQNRWDFVIFPWTTDYASKNVPKQLHWNFPPTQRVAACQHSWQPSGGNDRHWFIFRSFWFCSSRLYCRLKSLKRITNNLILHIAPIMIKLYSWSWQCDNSTQNSSTLGIDQFFLRFWNSRLKLLKWIHPTFCSIVIKWRSSTCQIPFKEPNKPFGPWVNELIFHPGSPGRKVKWHLWKHIDLWWRVFALFSTFHKS